MKSPLDIPRSVDKPIECSATLHPLMTLPDELLLVVASKLATTDLYSLCHVSKRLGSIAQDVLYRSVTVEQSDERQSSITQLAWTLIRRPDLARKVFKLSVSPILEQINVGTGLFDVRSHMGIDKVVHAMSVWMQETEIVGYILMLLSNLKELSLESMISWTTDTTSIIQQLYGEDFQSDRKFYELSKIPGFEQLRILSLYGSELQ